MNPEGRRGTMYGLLAYTLWGAFPLYFRLLERSGPVEIVAHRVFWSLMVCLGIVAATRSHGQVLAALRVRRQALLLASAAVLIAINWGVYIYAVNSGQVVEASLGYFVNPLVTVLLGVLVLRERLRPLQWIAVGTGVLAVAVLTFAYGRLPVIALTLAASFGLYGLMKKQVGGKVGALAGLTTETLLLGPFAAALIVWLQGSGQGHFTSGTVWQALLLVSAGVVTVVPLLLFAAAARRVPLSTIGLLQYLTPVLQLLCGVLLLGEHMAASRWVGFGVVWLALAMLTADGLRAGRRRGRISRGSRRAAEEDPLPA
ncbi:MAG TPA: EamA family transporter RarD [Kineosporiaceae bacterium]|nr:EamA family transporter RarD [Kineosporiaceae bacterium]